MRDRPPWPPLWLLLLLLPWLKNCLSLHKREISVWVSLQYETETALARIDCMTTRRIRFPWLSFILRHHCFFCEMASLGVHNDVIFIFMKQKKVWIPIKWNLPIQTVRKPVLGRFEENKSTWWATHWIRVLLVTPVAPLSPKYALDKCHHML